jgi:hypothetical protein
MLPLIIVALLALAHGAVYAAVLRHRPAFGTSTGVFWYHLVFSGGITGLLLAWLALTSPPDAGATAVAALSFLGIYSMSFLELWALADGGYSLAIMRYLAAHPGADEQECIAHFSRLGVAKQQQRLASIVTLGFARRTDDRLDVSGLGRCVASAAGAVLRTCNIRQRG